MHLDARGYIAIAEIVIYIPILLIGVSLAFKHGFERKAGWVFLVVLSIIRIVGGVTHVLSEQNLPNITYRIIYSIMESSGLSPLFMASLGFLGIVAQYSLEETPVVARGLKLLHLLGIIALVMSIIGSVNAGSAQTQSSLNSANNLRHVGIILFIVLYVGVIFATLFCWQNYDLIYMYRRQLLKGIAITLPFLGVRLVYGVLSSFAPSPVTFQDGKQVPSTPSNSGLGMFSSSSPDWGIYLVVSVIMEYIAVVIYVVVGLRTPLSKDSPAYDRPAAPLNDTEEGYKLGAYQQPYNYSY